MKLPLFRSVVIASLLCFLPSVSASAGIIIDGFTTLTVVTAGSSVVTDPLTGGGVFFGSKRTITNSGTGLFVAGGGSVDYSGGTDGSFVDFKYDFDATTADLYANKVLEVPFFTTSIAATFNVSVWVRQGATETLLETQSISTTGLKTFNGQLLPYSIVGDLDGIRVRATQFGDVGGGGKFQGSGPLQAVPEPATFAMLGSACFGGFGLLLLRRRKSIK